ncbi:ubiquinone carrier protein [Pseudoalteromonas rubra]|uniref:Ubiquinone biosynthesis accessory factor UbiJ n=1 Tax=Pseudoalteromonas rubra TaxID=43658 RepID=A0A5S3WJE5_9GAMM|nr:SCP2 sterol-binding domain-containing protein [Pseudoalteromonas rubra]TMP26755.1 ubiquinone carrier protein [Pseudoalteromonas rubra]TMP30728.1 ubiquinone carrier protein [Pseudoalteromonas rubra]
MWITLLTAVAESALEKLLDKEPSLAVQLSSVQHKTLAITLTDLGLCCALHYVGEQQGKPRCFVYGHYRDQADCHITTTLSTLGEISDPSQLTRLIREEKLDLDGDLQLAQSYSKAFSGLRIDWAEHLSAHLGDAPAQLLVERCNSAAQKGTGHLKVLQRTFAQLCQDELKVAVHPLEVRQFKSHTRQLAQQLAALEQRINALSEL